MSNGLMLVRGELPPWSSSDAFCLRLALHEPYKFRPVAGQSIALSHSLSEPTQQMVDAARVKAHKRLAGGEHRVTTAGAHQDPSHTQHPPRAIEDLLDGSLTVYHARIELVEHIAHLTHSLNKLGVADEVAVETLNRRARERDWCNRNQLRDFG